MLAAMFVALMDGGEVMAISQAYLAVYVINLS